MNQKAENLLNLALSATTEERRKSRILDVGYSPETRRWDLIVKYSGDIARYETEAIRIVRLSNEYAIINVLEDQIDMVIGWPQIEYVEKPKRLYFETRQGKQASCVDLLQTPAWNLTGKGVLVGVIDSGIDYTHPDFRKPDGTTRIVYLWDQSARGTPPDRFRSGSEWTGEMLDRSLETGEVLSVDPSGHGTAVASIAAGSQGIAFDSGLIVVKLARPEPDSFPRTTELMEAVDYVISKARELGMPVAVNLSFGNTYGSHDGTSLIETYLNDMANYWKTSIVAGTGNEGMAAGHTAETLRQGTEKHIPFLVQEYEPSLNIQLWKYYTDAIGVAIEAPNGQVAGPFDEILGPQRFVLGRTEVLVYYGEPSPYSRAQEIFVDLIPRDTFIDTGQWVFRLLPRRIVEGRVDLWMPVGSARNPSTRFVYATPETTLTIPSTASKVISVGAYDPVNRTFADFSGRGYTRMNVQVKPDLVAPGVGITAASPGGGRTVVSGTSFAAPFVTGSAALLMEYGIVNGNDPYLYGEKIKAYLIRGAKALPFASEYPNPMTGYGALCLKDSLPVE